MFGLLLLSSINDALGLKIQGQGPGGYWPFPTIFGRWKWVDLLHLFIVVCRYTKPFLPFNILSLFSADFKDVGDRDWDVEQAQAEVHGDDFELVQRLHPSDAAEHQLTFQPSTSFDAKTKTTI